MGVRAAVFRAFLSLTHQHNKREVTGSTTGFKNVFSFNSRLQVFFSFLDFEIYFPEPFVLPYIVNFYVKKYTFTNCEIFKRNFLRCILAYFLI